MTTPNPLQFLDSRLSVPSKQLTEPGPDDATLTRMLRAAVRVPDHGKLVPFRLLRIQGLARHALGEALVARTLQRDPQAPAAAIEKERMRFSHAPLIIAVIARLTPDHKVPEQEQLLSAGCVCFALLQSAQALGFGAQWLTGWAAYDEAIGRTLGLRENEKVVGFIHIGTPKLDVPERERPQVAALLSDWQPPSVVSTSNHA
ncbi:nitroreductase family protein [Pseudoxanthomonas sacheonensis]|uniref:nitroreductase family protein n=1 Tax=Pseudoxanthomonas sacheonensis TaxID=443615 RepID=UPI0013D5F3A6|nr:nitroreductase [Pseudoxanthomonas sacheonensis]KAF1706577.1 nitroreductase [Pseudoxanthomonas sacheonensis]